MKQKQRNTKTRVYNNYSTRKCRDIFYNLLADHDKQCVVRELLRHKGVIAHYLHTMAGDSIRRLWQCN